MRAAADARESRDFLLIARTDAKSQHGLEDAAARARAYIEAGADAALVVGANTPEELRYVADVVRAPLMAVIHETPPTTELTDDVLNAAGCAFAAPRGGGALRRREGPADGHGRVAPRRQHGRREGHDGELRGLQRRPSA